MYETRVNRIRDVFPCITNTFISYIALSTGHNIPQYNIAMHKQNKYI